MATKFKKKSTKKSGKAEEIRATDVVPETSTRALLTKVQSDVCELRKILEEFDGT